MPAASASGEASAAWTSSRSATDDRARGGQLSLLALGQGAGAGRSALATPTVIPARRPIVAARSLLARSAVGRRRLGRLDRPAGHGGGHLAGGLASLVAGAAAVVAARRPVVPARPVIARSAVLAGRRRRQRDAGRRLTAWRGATERGARRGHDPGRLGAHAQHAARAVGQDLEVEVVEARRRRRPDMACLMASSTDLPVNSWYSLIVVSPACSCGLAVWMV